MLLARSAWLLVLGCPTADQATRMWWSLQNVKNFLPVNYVPLSVMMVLGTPNLWIMSVKNSTACSDLIRLIGRASIHLENLSIDTSRWV